MLHELFCARDVSVQFAGLLEKGITFGVGGPKLCRANSFRSAASLAEVLRSAARSSTLWSRSAASLAAVSRSIVTSRANWSRSAMARARVRRMPSSNSPIGRSKIATALSNRARTSSSFLRIPSLFGSRQARSRRRTSLWPARCLPDARASQLRWPFGAGDRPIQNCRCPPKRFRSGSAR